MIAVGLDFDQQRLTHRDQAPPREPKAGEVLWKVVEVGVCGTDRELASFRLGEPPTGERFLVIGHEAVGRVLATGPGVRGLRAGDWVSPMIRRSCRPSCRECRRSRRDLCLTGDYTERGIHGMHGYFAEFAVDQADDLVQIPPSLAPRAVLLEPLSVVEKAVDTALRLHPAEPETALVLGAGPIGILAAFVLRMRGLEVTVSSLETEADRRVRLLALADIHYRRGTPPICDIVIEATGVTEAGFLAISRLARNGVAGILGARNGEGTMPFLDLIVKNQTVFGSVNASPDAFRAAAEDLGAMEPALLDSMLLRMPWQAYPQVMKPPAEAIKVVHVLSET